MHDAEARARFVYLVVRELGASGVRVREDGAPADDDPLVVSVSLDERRAVEATFAKPPADPADAKRRLLLLARAFESAIFHGGASRSHDAPERALSEELGALTGRAGAVEAFVIDARSPVIWGSARGLVGTKEPAEVVKIGRARRSSTPPEPPTLKRKVERALNRVRSLPGVANLARGGHIAHLERSRSGGYLARSFATIYVLVVVFEGPIDELRAERAIREHLPAIERIIVSLPPRDPQGTAKVLSLGAKRARR